MHNVGIIGLGIMGQRMLRAMSAHPEFNIAQIWDLNASLLKQTSAQYPDVALTQDAESLINNEELDLVYIATPPSTHIAYARDSLSAGKAIFCEKPLAVNVSQSQRLVDEIDQRGVPNAINFPFASDLNVQTLEEDLHAGLHGSIERIEMHFHFNAWPRAWQSGAASWLAGREQGGFLREVFSHFVYLTHRLVGRLEILSAEVQFPADPNFSELSARAQFIANGVRVEMSGAVGGAAPDFNEWTLYGSERSYRIQDWSLLKVANNNRWFDMMARGEPKPYLFHQLDNLSKLIKNQPTPLPSFGEALRVQEVVEGMFEYPKQ